jgi:hypothetical protein
MNCDEIKLTREMKRQALIPVRMDDLQDPWGTGLAHWFGVAEVLYHAGVSLPGEWEFVHGMIDDDPIGDYHGGDSPCPNHPEECKYCPEVLSDGFLAYECDCQEEREYVPFLDAGPLGVAMLTYAGNVLNRYLGFVKRAGRDY